MKKIITIIIILFVNIAILDSCSRGKSYSANNESSISTDNQVESITTEESDVPLEEEKSDESMNFEYFYRGFVTLNYDQYENYLPGTYVIETDIDWSDFIDNYNLSGINYFISLDFSKYYLIADIVLPARSTYSDVLDINSFYVSNNKLEVEYAKANKIFAQNTDDIIHVFVNILRTGKENIPDKIKNIYKK